MFEKLFLKFIESPTCRCFNISHAETSIFEQDKIYTQLIFVGNLKFDLILNDKGHYNVWFKYSDVKDLSNQRVWEISETVKKYLNSYRPIDGSTSVPNLYVVRTNDHFECYADY